MQANLYNQRLKKYNLCCSYNEMICISISISGDKALYWVGKSCPWDLMFLTRIELNFFKKSLKLIFFS